MASALALSLGPASASAGTLSLQSTFAGPIAASNALCTAEPRGQVYGTTNYNAAFPVNHRSHGYPMVTAFVPANAPSYLDLIPNLQAGARSDLCVGFTLPPDVEPQLVRDPDNYDWPRLQDTPAWADVVETHVSSYPTGSLPVHGDDLRNLSIVLPSGYAADFAAASTCSDAAFGATTFVAPTCPAGSQVGEAFVRVSSYAGGGANHATLTGLTLSSLAPRDGELGRLGVSIKAAAQLAPAKWVLAVKVASDGSGRLVAEMTDAARLSYDTASIAKAGDAWGGNSSDILTAGDARIGLPQPGAASRPLYVEGLSLRLWGAKSAHPSLAADFGAQASQCSAGGDVGLATTTFSGYPSAATTEPFSLVDCTSLPLPVTATATLSAPTAGAATGATFAVALPQTGTRLPAQPTGLELALPAGLELGPQLAAGELGQATCTAEQFAASSGQPSACPAAASVGTAKITTLVGPSAFAGDVYLGPPPSASALAALHVEVATSDDPAAPRLKFSGTLAASDSGRLVARFEQLPTLRMTGLELSLRGGDYAVLTAPRACGTLAGTATLTREAAAPATADFAVAVSAGCEPAAAPQLDASPSTPRSAGRPATSVAVTRSASGADLTAAAVTLPPGLFVAPAAIPECAADAAAAGLCPSASQLGSVSLRAGAGDHPLTITGDLFLTAAPAGAFAGAVLVAPVHLGELALGKLIAPASFRLDGQSRGLTLSATLPTRVGGVALDLRRVSFEFDRDGVIRQPTACGALPVSAVISSGAADATASTTIAYPSCGSSEFAPAFAATASGDAAIGGHPKLLLAVTPRAGDAGLRTVRMTLPPTLTLDVAATAAQCELVVFESGVCPAAAKVGIAGGKVTVAGDALGGDAFRVRVPGEGVPAIGIRFGGTFAHRALGRFGVGEGGATTLTFGEVPDVPLGRWALQLEGGSGGVFKIVAPPRGCAATAQWAADLTAWSGAAVRRGPAVTCGAGKLGGASDSPVVELSVSAKTGIKLKLTKFGAQQLQAAKLTVPKTVRINPPKAKRRGRTSIALIGAKATPVFTSGSLTLNTYGGVPSEVVARLRTTAYTVGGVSPERAAGKLKGKKRTVAFKLRLAYRDGTVRERSVSVRLP